MLTGCTAPTVQPVTAETDIPPVDRYAALTFDDDGTYLGQQLTLYPANISGTYPQNNFQPILVSGDAAQAVMKLIQLDTPYELAPYTDEAGCAQQPYLPAKDGDMEPVSIEEFSVEDD